MHNYMCGSVNSADAILNVQMNVCEDLKKLSVFCCCCCYFMSSDSNSDFRLEVPYSNRALKFRYEYSIVLIEVKCFPYPSGCTGSAY